MLNIIGTFFEKNDFRGGGGLSICCTFLDQNHIRLWAKKRVGMLGIRGAFREVIDFRGGGGCIYCTFWDQNHN